MSNTVKTHSPEPAAVAGTPKLRNAHVDFHGRSIEVKVPTEGQLAVMSRFARRFSPTPDGRPQKIGDAAEAVRVLARALDVATCVIVDQGDADWVEDLVMAGTIQLEDTITLMREAIEAVAVVNPGLQLAGDQPPAALVTG